jgi:hypothetical protein
MDEWYRPHSRNAYAVFYLDEATILVVVLFALSDHALLWTHNFNLLLAHR